MKASIDIPGITLGREDPKVSSLSRMIKALFDRTKRVVSKLFPYHAHAFEMYSTGRIPFPGAQPKSLCMEDIDRLCEEEHLCCEKSDGIRYLFLQTSDKKCYLMDRKCTFYQAPMEYLNVPPLPQPTPGNTLDQLDIMTDGELVEDTISGKKVLNYLIYDVLWVNGKNCMAFNYMARLSAIVPLVMTLRCNFLDSMNNSLIHIYVKDLFLTKNIDFVWNKVIPTLCHKNDGIVFTKIDCPYYPGTCNEILKWKPPEKNTVDFALVRGENTSRVFPLSYELQCMGKDNSREFFDMIFFESVEEEKKRRQTIKQLKDTRGSLGLAECYYDYEYWTEDLVIYKLLLQENHKEGEKRLEGEIPREKVAELRAIVKGYNAETLEALKLKGGWRVERIRGDKDKPNFIKVALNVRKSIEDNITTEILIERLRTASPKNHGLAEEADIAAIEEAKEESEEDMGDEDEEGEEGEGFSFDFLGKKRAAGAGDKSEEDLKKKKFDSNQEPGMFQQFHRDYYYYRYG
eukprot:TRINITY_DN1603_c0_g1_i1.p3 TRINITY_DN1603_c0_g1~~TRINITY_DN1603_c0_g1_i1.p3  ORF type:complete len:516 (+),score=69.92 TRINITY_DN1603_c0_g1_i1:3433-4980(+)